MSSVTKKTKSDEKSDIKANVSETKSRISQLLCEKIIFRLQKKYIFVGRIDDMREVYLCYRKRSKAKKFVLKFYKCRDYSFNEHEILQHMGHHENIQILTHCYKFDQEGVCVLVSPFIEDESFTKHPYNTLQSESLRLIFVYMKQLINAISFCHSKGILIRDIKPSNLLWNPKTEKLIMIDFGLASFYRDKGHVTEVGTEGFMAPEVVACNEETQKKSVFPVTPYHYLVDIYSAGVVLGSLLFQKSEVETEPSLMKQWRQYCKKYIQKIKKYIQPNLSEPEDVLRLFFELFLGMTHSDVQYRWSNTGCHAHLTLIGNKF